MVKSQYYYHEVLFKEQNGICAYCLKIMKMERGFKNSITVDHILAKANGGKNQISNYIGACERCNSGKGKQIFKKNKKELLARIKESGNCGYVSAQYICRTGQKVFQCEGKKEFDRKFNRYRINSGKINQFTYIHSTH